MRTWWFLSTVSLAAPFAACSGDDDTSGDEGEAEGEGEGGDGEGEGEEGEGEDDVFGLTVTADGEPVTFTVWDTHVTVNDVPGDGAYTAIAGTLGQNGLDHQVTVTWGSVGTGVFTCGDDRMAEVSYRRREPPFGVGADDGEGTCSISVTDFDPASGGVIRGTFSASNGGRELSDGRFAVYHY